MSDTIDRLVRLLDAAERRAAEAEGMTNVLRVAAMEKPYAPADSDEMARLLADVRRGSKIHAIKLHRQFCRTTLLDAKYAVERYWPAAPPPGDTE
jgi:ribosomal protein L7/L12